MEREFAHISEADLSKAENTLLRNDNGVYAVCEILHHKRAPQRSRCVLQGVQRGFAPQQREPLAPANIERERAREERGPQARLNVAESPSVHSCTRGGLQRPWKAKLLGKAKRYPNSEPLIFCPF